MSPKDLDPAVVVVRLEHLDQLVGVLSSLSPRPGFLDDDVTRLAVERILTQSVEIVVDVSTHVVVTQTGRAPGTYRDAVVSAAGLGVLDESAGADLARAVGLRNILVHEYLAVDLAILEASAIAAPALLGDFSRSVALWLRDR